MILEMVFCSGMIWLASSGSGTRWRGGFTTGKRDEYEGRMKRVVISTWLWRCLVLTNDRRRRTLAFTFANDFFISASNLLSIYIFRSTSDGLIPRESNVNTLQYCNRLASDLVIRWSFDVIKVKID